MTHMHPLGTKLPRQTLRQRRQPKLAHRKGSELGGPFAGGGRAGEEERAACGLGGGRGEGIGEDEGEEKAGKDGGTDAEPKRKDRGDQGR